MFKMNDGVKEGYTLALSPPPFSYKICQSLRSALRKRISPISHGHLINRDYLLPSGIPLLAHHSTVAKRREAASLRCSDKRCSDKRCPDKRCSDNTTPTKLASLQKIWRGGSSANS